MMRIAIGMAMAASLLLTCGAALAGVDEVALAIRNNRFEPAELRVPAGRKLRLVVRNLDVGPEEFESYELNREKVIAPGSDAAIYIGPLEPGRYPFFGDFHQATARGTVIAE
jgi:hypothetical protein